MERKVTHRYEDPLDRIWIATANALGLEVVRSSEVYAATDGEGRLYIGVPESLDADDCLAQIIFHELCHAMVQGDEALVRPDWGLDNTTVDDVHREHACLRLQAHLSQPYGLRTFLAPTTEHRAFYDGLGEDPLRGEPDDLSVPLATEGAARSQDAPWRSAIAEALRATAYIASVAATFCGEGDLFSLAETTTRAMHSVGFPLGPPLATCQGCAWAYAYRGGLRCRMAGRMTRADAPACVHWEGTLECAACGACCREAYGLVEIGRREPVRRHHPELITRYGGVDVLRRDGEFCAALQKGADGYRCRIYTNRPRTCVDFEVGGKHCLDARQRLGLTPLPQGSRSSASAH